MRRVIWSQLPQRSQLSQSTTIVVTPITIVPKNHNCRNANHNCRNLINHNRCDAIHNCRNFFEKVFDCVNINTYKVQAWSFLRLSWSQLYFSQYCCYFVLLINCAINTCSIQFECWDQLCFLYFFAMFAILCIQKWKISKKMEFVDKLTMIPKFCEWNLHALFGVLIYQKI